MPRKSKAPAGTVEYVNKPAEEPPTPAPTPAPSPSILVEPPKVDIPDQGSPTSAPPPPATKSKRQYRKKNGEYWEAMKGSRKELIKAVAKAEPVKETKNEVVVPPAPSIPAIPEKKKPGRPKKEKPVKPPPAPKPVKEKPAKAPKPPPAPKKVRVYESSSEEEDESESESESESEEEPEVEVVAKKATRRLKTLEKIDKRIKALSNPYSAAGRFSVF